LKTLSSIALFLALSRIAAAQQINTGLPFLKIGSDARTAAMGETGTALFGDHSAFTFNPAAIRFSTRHQLSIAHRQGFADVTSDQLGATLPGDLFTYGITAMTTSVSDIEVRQRPGEAEGTFAARNAALGAGISYSVTDAIAVGVTGKLLYEKIYIDEASGYALDAGLAYKISDALSAGAALLNIGSMSVLRSASSELPASLRIGGAYTMDAATGIFVTGAADMVKTLDDDGMHLHLGAEGIYDSMFMVRAGYQTGYETRSFTAGAGVRYGVIRIDYAFVPMTGSFSPTHAFSVMFFL
jgi:hypothetical protein